MNKISEKLLNNKWISFLIFAIFFTLPFERIPTFEYAGFTVKISYILSLLFLIVFLFCKPQELLKKYKLSVSDQILILFWFFSFLGSLITSPDIRRSIIILSLWGFVFLLYLIMSRLLVSPEIREKVFKIILFSSALVCLFGLFQFVGDSLGLSTSITGLRFQYTKIILGFPRIQSVALEPLYLANFLLVPLFIALVKYIQNKELFKGYFWVSILFLSSIILTISRGAYIALGITLLILFAYLAVNHCRENYYNKIIGLLFIVVISVLLSLGLIYKLNGKTAGNNFVGHSVVDNVSADGSAYDRIGMYKKALELFKNSPVLGNGAGSFGVLIQDKVADNSGYNIVNNEYLEILAENGLLGIVLFIGFLAAIFIEYLSIMKKSNEQNRLIILGTFLGLLAVFIQYNFFSTLYIIYIWAFLALLKGQAMSNKELGIRNNE